MVGVYPLECLKPITPQRTIRESRECVQSDTKCLIREGVEISPLVFFQHVKVKFHRIAQIETITGQTPPDTSTLDNVLQEMGK